jgi:hypothetical protein
MFALVLPLVVSLVAGCATTQAPETSAVSASGVRLATVAYITRAEPGPAQTARAKQVLGLVEKLRTDLQAGLLPGTADAVAAEASKRIAAADLPVHDRQLAQAILVEAIFLAGDTGQPLSDAQRDKVYAALEQVRRVAVAFSGTAP